MSNNIVSSTHRKRYQRHPGDNNYVDGVVKTGLDLLMEDGSLWFHPFDGSKPRQIQ